LTASGNADINHEKKKIEKHSGEDGLPWVQGKIKDGNTTYAGGKDQPPIHVIADTSKAGFNLMLQRDIQDDSTISNNNMV